MKNSPYLTKKQPNATIITTTTAIIATATANGYNS